MTATVHSSRESHSEWVRLRTLVNLRWIAVTGQIVAIGVAWWFFDINFDLPLCLLIIGATVVANLLGMLQFPENRRLSEVEAMLTLVFDTAQLALLLAVTGGLDNPFVPLILAPTTIAATALHTRPTIIVGGVTIVLVSLLAIFNEPLVLRDGTTIAVPQIYEFGLWLAIVISIFFLGVYARLVSSEIHSMGDALFATQLALSREQKLTDLGGVVAAAAHELGTPLATIKLVSSELADELDERPELRDGCAADPRSGRPLPRYPSQHGACGARKTNICAARPCWPCCAKRQSRMWTAARRFFSMPRPGRVAAKGSLRCYDSPRLSMRCAIWCRTPSILPMRRSGSRPSGALTPSRCALSTMAPAIRQAYWAESVIRS